ncbi:HAMP domain-containing protein [Actinoallomurus sp. NBC_01490]|uniref:HAMP domain-containing protein n=1 Tax=Actinoallomurus sp. NBC_01490 TaxID=2903557 RepID=UPI002E2F217B|nr:HAMP domain-containing protein [Actinoallomurus sp. NBC_01490]
MSATAGGRAASVSDETRAHGVDLGPMLAAMKALRDGDFRRRLPVHDGSATAELALAFNEIADRGQHLADELNRVQGEVVRHGRLDERLSAGSGRGSWAASVERANTIIDALVRPMLNARRVADAVADGDLTQRMDLCDGGRPLRGELRRLGLRINQMASELSLFTGDMTRLARELGTEGRLGGHVQVNGLSGDWRVVAEAINTMVDRLTAQIRDIAAVTKAVAGGDVTRSVTVEATGELLEVKSTVNAMVDHLSSFADEFTQVAWEVGTEGRLGRQARVLGVSGVWRDLTDSVNSMAGNLVSQVRSIAQVATAVAEGDLGKKIDLEARGEIRELETAVNTVVDTLSSFSSEVTRVAYELCREGRLGGQVQVEGVHGTWERLTTNVNELARTLTDQVRAIADVTSAVSRGDMTHQITLTADGEVSALKDTVNFMVHNLRAKDWVQSNLTRLATLMQGHRNLTEIADLTLRELAPLVDTRYGAFFSVGTDGDGEPITLPDGQVRRLTLIAGYGLPRADADAPKVLPKRLVRQAALEKRPILVEDAPVGYDQAGSGPGESTPVSAVIIPILFEDQLLGVIELASPARFSDVHLTFCDQIANVIGFAINASLANTRTEALLANCRQLTRQLQQRSDDLQRQQVELRNSNNELLEKAALLASASQYKSDFLAKMSHELRTPLTSMLIYARLLGDNPHENLSDEEVDFAARIHRTGSDLLQLINDSLDLSKVEAGRLDVWPKEFPLRRLIHNVSSTIHPLARDRGLDFRVEVSDDAPDEICSDEQRVQQILRNLLSNAIKCTPAGSVSLRVWRTGDPDKILDGARDVIALTVRDTGVGIARDKLAMIFDAFEQTDPAGGKHDGTGLGLSISRELATLLGGRIVAESEPGKGSTFTLYLPILGPGQVSGGEPERQVTEGHAVTERRSVAMGAGDGKRPVTVGEAAAGPSANVRPFDERRPERARRRLPGKVLVVDDDVGVVEALTALFARVGTPVLHAPNGQEGFALLQRTSDVSLVLMDIMMPVMDGYDAVEAIRRVPRYADLPIIVLSAAATPGGREKALARGASEYLQKPIVDVDRLLKIAHDLLDDEPPQPAVGDDAGYRATSQAEPPNPASEAPSH